MAEGRLRFWARLPVRVDAAADPTLCESENLSTGGMFVRVATPWPIGHKATLEIHLSTGAVISASATVVHRLEAVVARSLGRAPGCGFEFLSISPPDFLLLNAYVAELQADQSRLADLPRQLFAVIAEPSLSMAERISTALAPMGCESLVYTERMLALSACLEVTPDIVLARIGGEDLDAISLAHDICAEHSAMPIVLYGDRVSDVDRLAALEAGAREVVPMPFTDQELRLRVRRLCAESRKQPAEPVLQGDLNEISLPTLLSMFDFERKSGVLRMSYGKESASITFSQGAVIGVDGPRSSAGATSRRSSTIITDPVSRLTQLLDWGRGRFEFSSRPIESKAQAICNIQRLLLQHAQSSDESENGPTQDQEEDFEMSDLLRD